MQGASQNIPTVPHAARAAGDSQQKLQPQRIQQRITDPNARARLALIADREVRFASLSYTLWVPF